MNSPQLKGLVGRTCIRWILSNSYSMAFTKVDASSPEANTKSAYDRFYHAPSVTGFDSDN